MTIIKNGCICGGDYYTTTEQCDNSDCKSERKKPEETTLRIQFKENLSDNSIKMIKDILKGSLGFESTITILD